MASWSGHRPILADNFSSPRRESDGGGSSAYIKLSAFLTTSREFRPHVVSGHYNGDNLRDRQYYAQAHKAAQAKTSSATAFSRASGGCAKLSAAVCCL